MRVSTRSAWEMCSGHAKAPWMTCMFRLVVPWFQRLPMPCFAKGGLVSWPSRREKEAITPKDDGFSIATPSQAPPQHAFAVNSKPTPKGRRDEGRSQETNSPARAQKARASEFDAEHPAPATPDETKREVSTSQFIAYTANLLLAVFAWRFLRVRLYALLLLATDLDRLALQSVQSEDFALYALDGCLMVVTPIALAKALKVNPWPVAGLSACAVVLALREMHEGRGENMVGVYVSALAVAHVFTSIMPILSKEWRKDFDLEAFVLIGLSVSGFVGAFAVAAWSAWDLANAGNVAAQGLLAVLCLFASREDSGV